MENKKFIMVQDENTANKMISGGFHLVFTANGIWTFLNAIPQQFNFDNINIKKLVYTNRITL